jgi:hypothetical protein
VQFTHGFVTFVSCARIENMERVVEMTLLETILSELTSVPEPVLMEVLNLIQSVKNNTSSLSNSSSSPRIPGLHQGEVWMSEDFNNALPNEFFSGED